MTSVKQYTSLHDFPIFKPEAVERLDLEDFVRRSVALLDKLTRAPAPGEDAHQKGAVIPPAELAAAHGVVFLSWTKAGLGVSGVSGHGALLKRLDEGDGTGTWSPPLFLKLTGVSVGLSLGYETGESVLVLPTAADADAFLTGHPGVVDIEKGISAGHHHSAPGPRHKLVQGALPGVRQYDSISGGGMVDASVAAERIKPHDQFNHQIYPQFPSKAILAGDAAKAILKGDADLPSAAQPLVAAVQKALETAKVEEAKLKRTDELRHIK